MQTADGKHFRDLIRGMSRMYGQEPDALVLDAYWLALSDWNFADVQAAARQLMATAKFMPRPADFHELRRAGRPTSGESWARAVAACGSCHSAQGYTSGGTCGDAFIDRVVRAIGGYRVIAMCDSEKLPFLERRFAEHFDTMQDASDAREAVPQIAFSGRKSLNGPTRACDLLGGPDEAA